MTQEELIKIARELHSVHGFLPVPVAGKIPLGGTGWNLMTLEERLVHLNSPFCTGLGIQMGLVNHPYYGSVEARCIDCDIDDLQKSSQFATSIISFFPVYEWRLGRRPATIVFTEPGVIKREKFGPIQLLGAGKQAVWFGQYHNKEPRPTDPPEYFRVGAGLLDQMPPFVPADRLCAALEASVAVTGYVIFNKPPIATATPLTSDDLAKLTPEALGRFRDAVKSMLSDIERSPTGSGRGTKLYELGTKYGALIKASGLAPLLTEAASGVKDYVEFEVIDNPVLAQIGLMAEEMFLQLPGSQNQGDQRDFARGVAASKGLTAAIDVAKAKQDLPMPTGRLYPGQTSEDLLKEDLPPLRYLVPKYLTDSGLIIFAGKPKVGKGWIMLELGIALATGGTFWHEQCEQCEVLMYMLEDSKRRVQSRIKKLQPFFNGSPKLRFRYAIDGPYYVNADGTGTLIDDINNHLVTFPNTKAVVVDVLQRIRGEEKRTDNAYQADYKIISALQKLATERNILIMVVHHTKKGKVDDAIDSINGSFGVAGGADGSIVIGKEGDVVRVESFMRDIPNFKFDMVKDEGSPVWKPAMTAAEMFEPGEGTNTKKVLKALRDAACVLGPKDIALRASVTEKHAVTYLDRLIKSNQAERKRRGEYMATGLPYRERIEGIMDILKRTSKTPATTTLKEQYAPNLDIPPEAKFMILTPSAVREIEGGFHGGMEALKALKHRGLATFNSDTLWLIGDGWGPKETVQAPNPFAFKYPWEA